MCVHAPMAPILLMPLKYKIHLEVVKKVGLDFLRLLIVAETFGSVDLLTLKTV